MAHFNDSLRMINDEFFGQKNRFLKRKQLFKFTHSFPYLKFLPI
jgi:hypothetical protein